MQQMVLARIVRVRVIKELIPSNVTRNAENGFIPVRRRSRPFVQPSAMTTLMALPGVRCDHDVILIAFGLIELQGDDLRDDPLEQRKQPLAMLARGAVAITYNEHLAHDGAGRVRTCLSSRSRRTGALSRKTQHAEPCGASARKTGDGPRRE